MRYTNYKLFDGTGVSGADALEVVESMAARKFTEPRSRMSYRRALARRVKAMYNIEIDPSTDETFMATLLESDMLTPVVS